MHPTIVAEDGLSGWCRLASSWRVHGRIFYLAFVCRVGFEVDGWMESGIEG